MIDRKSLIITVIISVLLASLVVGGLIYYLVKSQTPVPQPTVTITSTAETNATPTTPPPPPNAVVLATAKVGDQINNFTITSIGQYDLSGPQLSLANAKVEFSGETTVSGRYYRQLVGNVICMDKFDTSSEEKLPQLQGDDRRVFFCFGSEDTAAAEALPVTLGFEHSQRTATVTIKNFTISRCDCVNYWNTAEFVSATNKVE